MYTVPQIISVTEMCQRPTQIFEKLNDGPIILADNNKPAAMLVSLQEWDRTVQDAQRYRRSALLRQLAEDDSPDAWGTMEELDAGLSARGWLDE